MFGGQEQRLSCQSFLTLCANGGRGAMRFSLDESVWTERFSLSRRRRTSGIRIGWLLGLSLMVALLATFSASAVADDDDDEPPKSGEQEEGFLDEEQDEDLPFIFRPEDTFIIPDGEIKKGLDRRVMLSDEDGQVVVGRIHVEGDDRMLVMMPDGKLVSVASKDVQPTDRPFEPASREDVEKKLLEGKLKGFKTRRTKKSRYLYVYNCSDTYAKATSNILETMDDKMMSFLKKMKLDIRDEPEFPLVVLMFADRDAFDDYRPMPPGVGGYYSMITNQIVIYEDRELTDMMPELALRSAVSVIAHEGCHQLFYNVGVQQRFSQWPAWVGEGLPEYCAPTETGKRIRWKGLGRVNNLRFWVLLQYREYRDREDWFQLRDTIEAERLSSLGYATAWGTVYGLHKSRKTRDKFAELMRDLAKLGPLEEPPEPGYYFTKHFGEDYTENRKHVVKELGKARKSYVDPIENQTYIVAVIERSGLGFNPSMISTSPKLLREWARETMGELADSGERSKLRYQAFPTRTQARQALARSRR